MSPLEPTVSLADLVAEQPARARLFERLHLDYCCGGAQTLAVACERRGLDAATVTAMLEALEPDGAAAGPEEERDWRQAGIGELCEHLVSVHHRRLRQELPEIAELLETVVIVHGPDHQELELVERAFASLRAELEPHLDEEERELFPACLALERDGAAGLDLDAVERHRVEHEGVGRKLTALRELAGGYDDEGAFCSTHLRLLAALRGFEADLHRHVHEENNVLFPRLRELAAAAAPSGAAL